MINTNVIILSFVTNNLIAITLFLGFLKGAARMTKNVHDDKIATLIANMFKGITTSSAAKNSDTTVSRR